jgi:glycosyltransferase involved in cell wall biosynthesis
MEIHTETPTKNSKIFYLITKSNFGGAQRYVFDLATHFRQNNDVAVITNGNGLLTEKLKEKGIQVIFLENLKRDVSIMKDIHVFFQLIRLFRKERPDVIHLNSSKIGGLGAIAGRIAGIDKIIFTGHGWAFNEDRNPLSKLIIKILYWISIIFSHITIAVSEKTRKQITDIMPFIKNKIIVIYNGIERPEFEPQAKARAFFLDNFPQIKASLSPEDSNGKIWIGTTSELHKTKGLNFIISALGEIKKDQKNQEGFAPFVFFILGEGEERKNLENLIKEENLENEVFLLGYVTEARKYLKAFDIFTLNSKTEALPYTILEAGSASLAVLASNVGGIPEIIEQLRSGILTKYGNVKEIREGLLLLMRDSNKRKAFGMALQTKVQEEFTMEKMYHNILSIY